MFDRNLLFDFHYSYLVYFVKLIKKDENSSL